MLPAPAQRGKGTILTRVGFLQLAGSPPVTGARPARAGSCSKRSPSACPARLVVVGTTVHATGMAQSRARPLMARTTTRLPKGGPPGTGPVGPPAPSSRPTAARGHNRPPRRALGGGTHARRQPRHHQANTVAGGWRRCGRGATTWVPCAPLGGDDLAALGWGGPPAQHATRRAPCHAPVFENTYPAHWA